jgi:hypothetical protein
LLTQRAWLALLQCGITLACVRGIEDAAWGIAPSTIAAWFEGSGSRADERAVSSAATTMPTSVTPAAIATY